MRKIIEAYLPNVEETMANLKQAWQESLAAKEKFKKVLAGFIK